MALRAISTPAAALRGSTALTAGNWEDDERQMELHALRAERDAIRTELIALRNLLTYAFGVEGWHIALNVRDRLTSLADCLGRRSL